LIAVGREKGAEEARMKRGIELSSRSKIVILAAILIFLAITVYFTFFYVKKCSDADCFNSMLVKCKKAEFLNSKEDSTWLYSIKGAGKGKCIVNVRNVWIKLEEAKDVQGKSMACYLPKGVAMAPESALDECHGLLKEALQDIIIERMHTYIVQNIGQISESLNKPL
jgi:hypothetical protein